jgi:hypothetical protein
MEDLRRPQWWAWVAGVLLAIFVLFETGSWLLTGIITGVLAGAAIYTTRKTNKPQVASKFCLDCGKALNANAIECRACGSARWSLKN